MCRPPSESKERGRRRVDRDGAWRHPYAIAATRGTLSTPRRVKKRDKSKYNKARVAFKGGGEMSCYQLCMTTLIGCPCV